MGLMYVNATVRALTFFVGEGGREVAASGKNGILRRDLKESGTMPVLLEKPSMHQG